MKEPVTIAQLLDSQTLSARMSSLGFSSSQAPKKAEIFADCAEALCNNGCDNSTNINAFFVPGRIEVLGKHTDYNGGRSLVTAVDKGFCFVAAPRKDSTIRILNVQGNEHVEFEIDCQLQTRPGHWSNYPMTVVRRIANNFKGRLTGADIAFFSDLPPASGMSSSSAMMIGFFMALSDINNLEDSDEYKSNIHNKEELGGYLGTVENGQTFGKLEGYKGVGTFGGSQDHTAILCCKARMLSRYSFCPVRFEQDIEMLSDYVFVVASSGVIAEKTGAALEKYNRASMLCRCATQLWNKSTTRTDPHLAAIIATSPDAPAQMRTILSTANGEQFKGEDMLRRFEHFLTESERIIPAASQALAEGDLAEFGKQVDISQEITDTLLQNQVPETIFLAKSARKLGAVAASAFGAGFGGSVWALTKKADTEKLIDDWEDLYKKQFPTPAANAIFLETQPASAAFKL